MYTQEEPDRISIIMVISDDTLENTRQYPLQYNHYHFQSAMQVPALIQLRLFNIEQGKKEKKKKRDNWFSTPHPAAQIR